MSWAADYVVCMDNFWLCVEELYWNIATAIIIVKHPSYGIYYNNNILRKHNK